MPSNKRLKDIEYNVFRKDMESGSPDGFSGIQDMGCITMLGGIVVTIIVIVVIVGFMQIGRSAPAATCAARGCSNKPRPGSSYCWLHGPSSTGSNSRGSSSSGGSSSSSGSGSVIGGSSGGSSSSSSSNSKIWSGAGSSSGSSGSSSGGSSVGSGN